MGDEETTLARWVLSHRKSGAPAPYYVHFSTSFGCNLSCKVCGQKTSIYRTILTRYLGEELGPRALSDPAPLSEELLAIHRDLTQDPNPDLDELTARVCALVKSPEEFLSYVLRLLPEKGTELALRPLHTAEEWAAVAHSAVRGGCRAAVISGGEPLMDWGPVSAIMEVLKSPGARVFGTLITNGTLLDRDKAEFLVGIGWDAVLVSLDGPDPASNDVNRGPGTFDRAVAGLERLRDARERAGSQKPATTLNVILHRGNMDRLKGFFPLARRLGVGTVTFNDLHLFTPEAFDLAIPADEEPRVWSLLESLGQSFDGIRTNASLLAGRPLSTPESHTEFLVYLLRKKWKNEPLEVFVRKVLAGFRPEGGGDRSTEEVKRWTCYEPELSANIGPDFRVSPCCFLLGIEDVPLKGTDVLSTVGSPEWRSLADKINSDRPFRQCNECANWVKIRSEGVDRALRRIRRFPPALYLSEAREHLRRYLRRVRSLGSASGEDD